MKRTARKKLNLTIEPSILAKAKQVAEFRGSSISALVEDFLSRLVSDLDAGGEDSLAAFYKRYFKRGFKEPSDATLRRIKSELGEKHQ